MEEPGKLFILSLIRQNGERPHDWRFLSELSSGMDNSAAPGRTITGLESWQ